MTYIGGQQYLLSYEVVQCTFAFCSGIGMEGPHRLLFYKQVFSERKTYGIELYGTFSIFCNCCSWLCSET